MRWFGARGAQGLILREGKTTSRMGHAWSEVVGPALDWWGGKPEVAGLLVHGCCRFGRPWLKGALLFGPLWRIVWAPNLTWTGSKERLELNCHWG